MPDENVAQRQEPLTLVFQEILTAIERLRANRQAVSDAETFRAHMRDAIRIADQDGRKRGYASEDIRVALFAVVALLDESVLNLRSSLFADWPRKTMQEELFGGHNAGEIFFQNVDRLLQTNDSETLTDVLEVYELCLLLGYVGKYSVSGKGDLRSIREAVSEKIRRTRKISPWLSPAWKPPAGERAQTRQDAWVARLLWAALVCSLVAVALFVAFKISLSGGGAQLASLAAGNR